MEYTLDWAAEQKPFDEVVEHNGARVLIDPKAVMYLLGTEMDYKTDKLSAQFVFTNPNQTGSCGCGESVNLAPAADRQARGAAGLIAAKAILAPPSPPSSRRRRERRRAHELAPTSCTGAPCLRPE